ncbi:MAG: hypothetical protein CYPHOPRED_004996 [Cyphobasidiales sp. Tagirdzhanova-0007]|nr:MAG: hypothetical protein CYPHOPRED_004996 [Cyphobasidiales sp. Tagirdzhanova-0007]
MKANLYDFSAVFDFSGFSQSPTTVLGYQFVSLTRETRFLEDFYSHLHQSLSELDERWYTNGYQDLFASEGDRSDPDRVFWGVGKGSQKFILQAEGCLGTAPGIIETIPLCLLLGFLEKPSIILTANISVKARLENSSSNFKFLSHTRNFRRQSVTFPVVKFGQGPSLPLERGDSCAPRRSFILAHTHITSPLASQRPSPKGNTASLLIIDFLGTLSTEQRMNIFLAGEKALLFVMEDRLSPDFAAARGVTWTAIRQSVYSIYSNARKIDASKPPSQVFGLTPLTEPVAVPRDVRATPTVAAIAPAVKPSDDSPLDPGCTGPMASLVW